MIQTTTPGPYDASDAVALDGESLEVGREAHNVHSLNELCENRDCPCGGSDPDEWLQLSDSESSGEWPAYTGRNTAQRKKVTKGVENAKGKAAKKSVPC